MLDILYKLPELFAAFKQEPGTLLEAIETEMADDIVAIYEECNRAIGIRRKNPKVNQEVFNDPT